MASLFTHIDLYCERLGPEFWSEPINALTNLAFVLVGIWGVLAVRRNGVGAFAESLAWWVAVIGVGSTLFHTFANSLTIWADILPIASFTLAYTVFLLRRFLAMSWPATLATFIGFYTVAGLAAALVPEWLRVATNGSTGYLPAFLALIFFGGLTLVRRSPAAPYNFVAAAIFIAAVTCRSLDQVVCPSFPVGTHFLWHVFNALMLGVLLAAVVRYGSPDAAPERRRTRRAA